VNGCAHPPTYLPTYLPTYAHIYRWDLTHANCSVPEEDSNVVSSDGSAGFASSAQLEALGLSARGNNNSNSHHKSHSSGGAGGASSRGGGSDKHHHHHQQQSQHQQHGNRNSALPAPTSTSSSSALSRSRTGGKEVCEWVACDWCSKWRKLPPKINPNSLPDKVCVCEPCVLMCADAPCRLNAFFIVFSARSIRKAKFGLRFKTKRIGFRIFAVLFFYIFVSMVSTMFSACCTPIVLFFF